MARFVAMVRGIQQQIGVSNWVGNLSVKCYESSGEESPSSNTPRHYSLPGNEGQRGRENQDLGGNLGGWRKKKKA